MGCCKYVYALSEADKNELLVKGFKFIGERNLGKHQAFLFESEPNKALFFNEANRKKFLFSNIIHI